MTYTQSIVLGVVQGLGEFLPISSSAHLIIAPWLFNFEDPGLTFDVALHFGTLFAIVCFFWRDWVDLFYSFSKISLKMRIAHKNNPDVSLSEKDVVQNRIFIYLVIATIPGALIGFLLEHLVESLLRHPLLIAFNMSFMGAILWYADLKSKKSKTLDRVTLPDIFIVGLCQALALVPGVSRSGVTMTSGLIRGMSRETAARFSFLLAAPITFGACLVKAKAFLTGGVNLESIIGILVSAIVGFLSIKYLLKYVQKHDFRIFVYYRFAFSIFIFAVYWFK